MLHLLRLLFATILVSMLWVTGWASLRCPLFAVPRAVIGHPWFIATLFDTYWGFLTFYIWVAYKQTAWTARVAWFLAIMLLGNIAMSSYCLRELSRKRTGTPVTEILTCKDATLGIIGPLLAILGTIVVIAAAI